MKLFIVLPLIFFSSFSFSLNEERIELSNYLRELNKIDRIILNAKLSKGTDEKTSFKYSQLSDDLNKIKGGIQEYLDMPNRSPRSLINDISPIDGDYH
ncbi:hypothetical protein DS885_03785 [Psychromonas sp. B3M02]|uniref:integrative conjugative element protein, RAQPRD family n=1 Tax=Psychromonas sp. B3M02 TaxID=2267226 RepID=UPI000DEB6761|nr:RAQPRD family integrative conjugative element protein [Psychromonas sp. B3M02]RBW47277.1 hypothetical protein DS885_03785 [Psychromonas sp. B3M02]